jgi:hypothetical protein
MRIAEMELPVEARFAEAQGFSFLATETMVALAPQGGIHETSFKPSSGEIPLYVRGVPGAENAAVEFQKIAPEATPKTGEDIWQDLSRDGKIVAVALSQYPFDVTKETVEAMIAAQNEHTNGQSPFDVTNGFLELNTAGVLQRMTALERAEDMVKRFEAKSAEEQARIQQGRNLNFRDERELREYLGAQGSINDYKSNPFNPDGRWERVGYTLSEPLKELARKQAPSAI